MAGREQLFSDQSLLPAPGAGLGWQFLFPNHPPQDKCSFQKSSFDVAPGETGPRSRRPAEKNGHRFIHAGWKFLQRQKQDGLPPSFLPNSPFLFLKLSLREISRSRLKIYSPAGETRGRAEKKRPCFARGVGGEKRGAPEGHQQSL